MILKKTYISVLNSRLCRPVFKEFDEWPQISLEPDPPKVKKEKKDSLENLTNTIKNTPGQK